jgi:glycosyltransferase involved in cell wall biosynthesis
MIKLTVAIPTYNRSKFLIENLNNLILQSKNLSSSIELVVSDNASIDDTKEKVLKLIAEGAPIKYYRNNTNLGMDENADLSIQRSKGQFVLLLGDDDLLESNALEKILECLTKYPDLGILYMNFRIYDCNMHKEIDFRDQAFDPIEVDSYFPEGISVVEKTHKIFAAISGGVYRRELWQQADPKRFLGTIFIHVGVTLDILCRVRAPAYIFKRPLFKYRLNDSAPGKIKSYSDIFAVSFGLLRILTAHKRYIPAQVFHKMYHRELIWTREKIIGAKARESVPILENFRLMRGSYDISRLDFWIVDVPMLLIPRWLLSIPYQLYRLIKYR